MPEKTPRKEPTYIHNSHHYIGVIVANLGTPDAPTKKALRRYLKQFLSDRRVVEAPKILWWFILNLIILNTRPKKSAAAYAKVWDEAGGGSPLRIITQKQAQGLQQKLDAIAPNTFKVTSGMRYGNPSTKGAVANLKNQNCDKLFLMPLYPHYAGATVGSACDSFFDALKTWRWMPTARVATPYFDHEAYIDALAEVTQQHLTTLDYTPELIVMSYHGIPQKTWDDGDPYPCHCRKTTRLLAEKMGWPTHKVRTTFQSRFGPAEWVKPYTDKTLEALPQKEDIKKVMVMTPAFHTDCLETLEEIAMEGKEIFMEAGGTHYSVVPCLNASNASLNLLTTLVLSQTTDWLSHNKADHQAHLNTTPQKKAANA